MRDETRIPVIVGGGQINDRPADDEAGRDPLGLMQAALLVAAVDAGGGWLSQIDTLAVVDQISFPELGDVSRPLADVLGAKGGVQLGAMLQGLANTDTGAAVLGRLGVLPEGSKPNGGVHQ